MSLAAGDGLMNLVRCHPQFRLMYARQYFSVRSMGCSCRDNLSLFGVGPVEYPLTLNTVRRGGKSAASIADLRLTTCARTARTSSPRVSRNSREDRTKGRSHCSFACRTARTG